MKFTEAEMETVRIVVNWVSKRANFGYKNAIESNTLPHDLTADKNMLQTFVRSVKNFHLIESKLLSNNPDQLTKEEWDGFILLCCAAGNDAEIKGGPLKSIAETISYALENIFLKRGVGLR